MTTQQQISFQPPNPAFSQPPSINIYQGQPTQLTPSMIHMPQQQQPPPAGQAAPPGQQRPIPTPTPPTQPQPQMNIPAHSLVNTNSIMGVPNMTQSLYQPNAAPVPAARPTVQRKSKAIEIIDPNTGKQIDFNTKPSDESNTTNNQTDIHSNRRKASSPLALSEEEEEVTNQEVIVAWMFSRQVISLGIKWSLEHFINLFYASVRLRLGKCLNDQNFLYQFPAVPLQKHWNNVPWNASFCFKTIVFGGTLFKYHFNVQSYFQLTKLSPPPATDDDVKSIDDEVDKIGGKFDQMSMTLDDAVNVIKSEILLEALPEPVSIANIHSVKTDEGNVEASEGISSVVSNENMNTQESVRAMQSAADDESPDGNFSTLLWTI